MVSRLRVQGHPIQPLLVTLPVGLFACATLFDLADVGVGPELFGEVGYWTAVAALVAAALTGVAGMIDLWDVPAGHLRRTAVTFNLANVAMAAVFVLVCLTRADAPEQGATWVHLLADLFGLAIGGVGVRLGARLGRQFERRGAEARAFDPFSGRVPGAARETGRRIA